MAKTKTKRNVKTKLTKASALMTHPDRTRIMRQIAQKGETSPRAIADDLSMKLGNVAYHVRALREAGWIEDVRTEPARGALRHIICVRPGSAEQVARAQRELASLERIFARSEAVS